jgi:hypothetical protein
MVANLSCHPAGRNGKFSADFLSAGALKRRARHKGLLRPGFREGDDRPAIAKHPLIQPALQGRVEAKPQSSALDGRFGLCRRMDGAETFVGRAAGFVGFEFLYEALAFHRQFETDIGHRGLARGMSFLAMAVKGGTP